MSRFDSYAQGTPSWIEHSSPDAEASREFYGELFGWSYDVQPATDGFPYALALVEGDQVAGLGGQFGGQVGGPASWGVYLAADDVDAVAARAEAAGGDVLVPPSDVGPAGRMAWLRDPGGATVGLWQGAGLAGAQRANEPGTNQWNELTVADIGATAGFYEQVLGVDAHQQDMGPDGPSYTTFDVDGRAVAGSMELTGDMTPHWSVYFNVDDVDATVARAQALGAEVVHEAFDVPGTGRFGYLRDPQGATFNLMANPPTGDATQTVRKGSAG
jgi:predicted enzyme related to lactoylglutathione lyase